MSHNCQSHWCCNTVETVELSDNSSTLYSLVSQTYFARAVYCVQRKEGGGENTFGVFGQVCVHCRNVGSTNQITASGN